MVRLRVLVLIIGFLTTVPGIAADAISAEAVIEKVMPAIVTIRADTPEGVQAGTGFLVDPALVSEQKGFVHHHHPSSFHHSIPMPSHITKWKMDTTKPTVNHFGTCT